MAMPWHLSIAVSYIVSCTNPLLIDKSAIKNSGAFLFKNLRIT